MEKTIAKTGCFEFYLRNNSTGSSARVISNSLLNACMALEWDPTVITVDGCHETYGRVLEKAYKEDPVTKTSEDLLRLKSCY